MLIITKRIVYKIDFTTTPVWVVFVSFGPRGWLVKVDINGEATYKFLHSNGLPIVEDTALFYAMNAVNQQVIKRFNKLRAV